MSVPTVGACPAKGIDRFSPKSIALVSSFNKRYFKNFMKIGWKLFKFSHAIAKSRLEAVHKPRGPSGGGVRHNTTSNHEGGGGV